MSNKVQYTIVGSEEWKAWIESVYELWRAQNALDGKGGTHNDFWNAAAVLMAKQLGWQGRPPARTKWG